MGEDQNLDSVDGYTTHTDHTNGNQTKGRLTKMAVENGKSIQNGVTGCTKVTVSETIKITAQELASDIVFHIAGLRKGKAPSKHASTLRRTVQEMTTKHEILYKGMINKLQITEDNYRIIFTNVANEIFRDGQFNWGRLVSVYAFGAQIGKQLSKLNGQLVNKFAKFLGNYVSETLGLWINDQDGWDAFDEYFPEQKNIEDSLWKGLVFTAFGLGALATMVAAVR